MRIRFLMFLFFVCFASHSQFLFMNANVTSGPVLLTLEDGTVRSGQVKNNKIENIGRRILESGSNNNALGYANFNAPTILFQEEGGNDFEKINSDLVKKVVFLDEAKKDIIYEVYKCKVRILDVKNFKLNEKVEEQTYFLSKFSNGPLEVYGFKYVMLGGMNRQNIWAQFIKNPGDDYLIGVQTNGLTFARSYAFKILRYAGRDCEAYSDFVLKEFIEGKGYQKHYKPALAEIKKKKKEIIQEARDRGMRKREAKEHYEMHEQLLATGYFNQKYSELCR